MYVKVFDSFDIVNCVSSKLCSVVLMTDNLYKQVLTLIFTPFGVSGTGPQSRLSGKFSRCSVLGTPILKYWHRVYLQAGSNWQPSQDKKVGVLSTVRSIMCSSSLSLESSLWLTFHKNSWARNWFVSPRTFSFLVPFVRTRTCAENRTIRCNFNVDHSNPAVLRLPLYR